MISTSEIKKLAQSYDELVLKALGFQSISERGVQQSCPVHKGDNALAFSYDRNKNCWSCFTHNCHKKYGNDIVGLVRSIKNFTYVEAMEWIHSAINSNEIDSGYIPKDKIETIKSSNSKIDELHLKKLKKIKSVPDKCFKEDTIDFFGCGLVDDKSVKPQHHRIMIPIRDRDGFLIGFSGRSIYKKCSDTGFFVPGWLDKKSPYVKLYSKWRHYPKGLNKSIELYNAHHAKDWIKKLGFVIVVEGPFDLWRLWEFGVKNCVACYGCNISNKQIDSIKSFGAKCAAIMFDSDKAGQEGYNKSKILHENKIDFVRLILPDNKDPAEITAEEYDSGIKPQLSFLRKKYEH